MLLNTLDLEEQRKRLNGKEVKLTEICAEVDVPKDIKKYRPRIIAFKLNAEILEALPEIIHRSNGKLFQRVWDNTAEDVRKSLNRALRIDDIMEHVWKPAYKEWKALHQRLKTGEIFFREFDRLCGHIDLEILPKEFLILEDGKKSDWIKERVEQITSYKNLQNCLDGASIIKRVVKEFELKGDFQPVKQIWKMTEGKNMKMNSLNKSYLETFAVLSDVDERKINCLLKFVESKNLVNWLKKKMKNLKELKFFVNLAYISTGDKGLEIAKVRCLNSAAIGYAPLIFNLKSNCDYKLFLKRCEKVWNVLLKNPNLPTELLDTCRELKWLKIVDKSQGNVQITSLAQAEAINLNGTYYIGSHKTGDAVQRNGQHQLQLSDALKLRVIDKDGKLEQEYNYEQLHDLQSRLMLVAGKAEMGKDDVDRFMLFTVKFRCDPQSVTCAFVSFGEREKSTIIGKIDAVNKDVCFFIPKIAKFLEQCHEKWLEFIDRKREDYYILNYFNIEQMVILQHELVKMGFECEPSDLIYPLLSIIKHDCTREDLVNAMKEAKDELKQMDKVEEEGVPEEEEVQEEDDSKAAERKFVLEMVNYGFSEDLARKALKYVTPNQILKGIAWCAKHEEDMETSPTDGTPEQNQEQTFSGWITGDLPSATVAARLWQDISNGASQGLPSSVDTLIENLEKLWGKFVGSISSSVKDYLSVEHLALILRKLVPDKDLLIFATVVDLLESVAIEHVEFLAFVFDAEARSFER
ncbi:Hypothetical predicted protein [Mytilus galloprovincialis]|uniref:UBA domain-containing protein n=1 Tax=Mytilus galloprovincialis TaxID=29158 RepID=A0A8B6BYK0_MYTGA|nr:Hypothetical predicted protein [Mytilus galloprovincialis]